MPDGVIRKTCRTCQARRVNKDGRNFCQRRSPQAQAILGPGPKGQPTVIAVVTFWPNVELDEGCEDHLQRTLLEDNLDPPGFGEKSG